MNDAFAGPFELIDDTRGPAMAAGAYSEWVQQKLAALAPNDQGILRVRRPKPTAAFSPQDATHKDYQQISSLMRARGFEPVERGTGGRLTVFDEAALAVTLIAPHSAPHQFMMARYERFSGAVAAGLRKLGIDTRVGELPQEYCPGKFSINAAGRVKLVGIAQRMNRRGYQMGAIIAVEQSASACAAIADAYRGMGLAFDAATYGSIRDFLPGISHQDVFAAVVPAVQAIAD